MRALAPLALFIAAFASGCGPNQVGEACAYPGETRDCVEGSVCTPDIATTVVDPYAASWASYTCRLGCSSGIACPEGYACRGVTGREMLTSCQPVAPTE